VPGGSEEAGVLRQCSPQQAQDNSVPVAILSRPPPRSEARKASGRCHRPLRARPRFDAEVTTLLPAPGQENQGNPFHLWLPSSSLIPQTDVHRCA